MTNAFKTQLQLREQVLAILSPLLVVIGLILFYVNGFITHKYIMAFGDLLFSFVSFIIAKNLRQKRPLTWQPAALAGVVSYVIIYTMQNTDPRSGLIFWTFSLPALYHVLFHRYLASILTAAMFLTIVIFFIPYINLDSFPFALLNFSLPFALIWAMSFSYEHVRLRIQEHLKMMALTDSLTGAFNRLALKEDAKCWPTDISMPRFLLHLDLDHFKKINDTYGHSSGDAVLQALVPLIQHQVPEGRVYRVGGEEFCVVFQATDDDSALALAQQIRLSIAQSPIKTDAEHVYVSISAGLLLLDPLSGDVDNALHKSDFALYQAKQQGRNQVVLAN